MSKAWKATEREIAEKNKILEIITGSFLYGTNTETSDKDFVGVFMPSVEYVLGFRRCEEVDFSIIDKEESGKNSKEAIDKKLYEFRKFIKLAMENNPNILEILFVNKENTIFINDIGREILSKRHLFPYKGLKQKFLGYAFAQKHKMIIKKDNYFDLISAFDYLQKFDEHKTILEIVLDSHCPSFLKKKYNYKNNLHLVGVGDMDLNPTVSIKLALRYLEERISKVGNREELLLKYAYDTKFGSHLVRLMLEGIELLKTGELIFPLKEAPMILDIKNGKWAIDKVLKFSEDLEKEIESLVINSKLPDRPNIEELEKFTIKKLKEVIC